MMTTAPARITGERGSALVIALMAIMLLSALGATVVMVGRTESTISANYRNSQEALYAADAGIERVVQDLLMVPRWNDILGGTVQSAFVDGAMTSIKTLPWGGGRTTLCCAAASATGQLQAETDARNAWPGNNPVWRLYAWGPLAQMLTNTAIDSPMYLAVWIADDPAETDNDPLSDTNGVLTLRAEAVGPSGAHKTIEVTVARTSSTEIERGQIAQRGQEELNQRARKAAVQTPGRTLTNSRMNTRTGNLTVQ